MDSLEAGFTMDDFTSEEASVENTAETIEEVKTESAESTPETKAAEPTEAAEEKRADNSGAESPQADEYTADFTYSIKDEQKEFPEWIREVVKTKEDEEAVRDLFTRAEALEGLKESRDRVEQEFNEYQQNFENKVIPTLKTIDEFDKANATKDFGRAWELSDVDPKDVVDYMLMDENLSNLVYQKVLDQFQAQENGGPQAIDLQRKAWNESRQKSELELQNKELEARLARIEQNSFNQSLDFVLMQNQDNVGRYEQINGAGSFKKFVEDYTYMQRSRGQNMSPVEAVNQSLSMLGMGQAQPAPQSGTNETINTPAKVEPQVQKTPEALPNLGTGSNVSMVQEVAGNWDDWKKNFGANTF